MIDSHAHIWFEHFDEDRDLVLERARNSGVRHMIIVGIDLASSKAAAELTQLHDDLHPTAGFHPDGVEQKNEDDWKELERLLAGGQFVAVGETGLDHYWNKSSHESQEAGFLRHLALGKQHDLPVIIHCRDAMEPMLQLLESRAEPVRGVMHCFSGDIEDMNRCLDLGLDISFAGPLSYPRARELRAACAAAPSDRIHVETDCPFLPPQPHRGKRNEPAMMVSLLKTMAKVRNSSLDECDRLTEENSMRLFRLNQ